MFMFKVYVQNAFSLAEMIDKETKNINKAVKKFPL